jgi:mono/diheme cytochrome c family protein
MPVCRHLALQEAFMLKPILPLCAGAAFVLVLTAASGRAPQQDASALTQAPAETPVATTAPPSATSKAPDMKNPVKPTAESQAKAKQLYRIDCAMCHGDNGNGKTDIASGNGWTLSDWTSSKALADRMDGELFNVIRNGKGNMPSEAVARASNDQVWNLVIYIRSFAKGQPAAPVSAPAPAPASAETGK